MLFACSKLKDFRLDLAKGDIYKVITLFISLISGISEIGFIGSLLNIFFETWIWNM
jgi:hypothetical protein